MSQEHLSQAYALSPFSYSLLNFCPPPHPEHSCALSLGFVLCIADEIFSKSNLIPFLRICFLNCMSLCEFVHVSASACVGQKKMLGPLQLEQAVVSS